MPKTFADPRAEAMRVRYRYRRLILRGELRLPREAAVPLVGPDCAYHLYATLAPRGQKGDAGGSGPEPDHRADRGPENPA